MAGDGSAKLKERRRELRLTLRDIESQSGVSNAYISQIESGKRPSPHPQILKKLASAYQFSIEEIMRIFGYLGTIDDETETEEQKTTRLFNEACSDPDFAFGHRLRGERDLAVKKAIVELYLKLKSKGD